MPEGQQRQNIVKGLPPMESLVAVLQTAKLGSLSAAAEELGLTHGAVSRRIKYVEAWLSSAIFERHGRGMRLTGDGALFVQRIERLVGALASTADDIRSRRPQRPIRISVLPSFARLWLIPRLREIEGADPTVAVRIIPEHGIAILDGRDTDMAVRSGYGDWQGVKAERLFGERLFPIAAPAVAAEIGQDGRNLFELPLLHDSDSGDWKRWARDSGQAYVPAGGERRFADYDLVLAAAAAGLGIALARMPLASAVLARGELVRLPGPAVEIGRAHWIALRPGEDRPHALAVAGRLKALAAAMQ